MSIAQSLVMTRQWKGAALAIAFVAAFVISIAFHSVVAAVTVLLSAVTVSYVIGIAWMRTSTHRERDKPHSLP
jgi:multisubunit Na+/H+ antiporter MnhG subunit